jgi:predicted phosphodiesterase
MFKECGVRLVLHGHLHESGDYRHNGTWYVNSGASLIGKDPRTLSAHVIRLRDQEIRLETIILSQPATGRAGSSLRLLHHHTIDSAA